MVLSNCSDKKVGISFLSYHEGLCIYSPRGKILCILNKGDLLPLGLSGSLANRDLFLFGNMSNSLYGKYITTHTGIMTTLSPCLQLLSPKLRDHTPSSFHRPLFDTFQHFRFILAMPIFNILD